MAWRAVSGSRYFILSLSLSLSHSFFLSVHLALFCFWLAVRGWTLFDAEWLHSLLIAVETGFYLSSQVGDTCFIKTNKQTNQVKQIKGSGGRKKKKKEDEDEEEEGEEERAKSETNVTRSLSRSD